MPAAHPDLERPIAVGGLRLPSRVIMGPIHIGAEGQFEQI